ncbi:MAG TPA: tetratricopeptide repeat protein [Casimicrobiaceae bacterium]|nr:tetratricopeptide repeat protein [Casimicrobiaceae bacterium]
MNTVVEIGPFRLDAAAGVLTRSGVPVGLGPRAVAVLGALVERANQFVAKTVLIDTAWPNVVVEEANLAVQISAIRRVLAQAPGGENWVETLARRGYRFVGPATTVREPSSSRVDGCVTSNLPAPITSFVGRERELVEIKRLLSRARLLTLVGVGGIGKTRIALQAAAEVLDAYSDGVWFVDLAPIADAALVPSAVAQVLGVRETAETPLVETLCGYARQRQVLLLLDNCEHLLAGCATLADTLLSRAAELSIIATSREPLHVAGEQTYPLPTLSLPDANANAETMGRSEAVQLFVERAERQQPGFALTDARASAVAQLCIHLDGIPLALELAAARIRSLSVEEISVRLNDRFKLLIDGNRTALPRHQTLRATLDWSYDLLSNAEKALLCRVSIFSGGWTLEAAEQVCAGDDIAGEAVLEILASLAHKSLVMTEERGGATRYRLLETVLQYARDRLRDRGEESRWRGRHLAYFLAEAEAAEPELTGPEQQVWLDLLEADHDNLRSALAWSSAAGGDAEGGLRLAAAVWRFWYGGGYLGEGRRWFSELLARVPGGTLAATRAKALNAVGSIACRQGDYPAARTFQNEGLAIWRALGDPRGITSSLNNLGVVAHAQGDYPSARAIFKEILAIRRELGDRPGIASTLNNLGALAFDQGDRSTSRALHEESLAIQQELGDRRGISMSLNNLGELAYAEGDYRAARTLYEESLAIKRELGQRWGIATSLDNLGNVASELGDYSRARTLHEEGLAIRREIGDRQGVATSLSNLGSVARNQGAHVAARTLYAESLAIRRELGERRGIAESLEGLAYVASALASPDRAARIWAGAERLREEIGAPLQGKDRPRCEHQVAIARAAMGDDAAFNLAWQEGRAMSLEQVVQNALEGLGA